MSSNLLLGVAFLKKIEYDQKKIGETMYSIEVKKSKNRQFLVFCTEMVNTPKMQRRKLWNKALDQRIVVVRMPDGNLPRRTLPGRGLAAWEDFEYLICNVKRIAKRITAREDFLFEINPPRKRILIKGSDNSDGGHIATDTRPGIVRYIIPSPGYETHMNQLEYEFLQFKTCGYDTLSSLFLDVLTEYGQIRGVGYFKIPLRLCEWCEDVFFGKRHDQRFCCRDHAQRWHAKNYQLRKKTERSL